MADSLPLSMPDLTAIYNAFDSDEPLPGDDVRYVELAAVRGESKIARKLVQRIKNAREPASYHLVMGHTKCGKTTELNRTRRLLEDEGYVTVFVDTAEMLGLRSFEYTAVLLLVAGQVVAQLAQRAPRGFSVRGASAQRLAEFLLAREITFGGQISGDASGHVEARAASGLLMRLLGELGLGFELRGGFQKSRDITVKIESDTRGFLEAVQDLVRDASEKVLRAGYKGLVVICDGCDKLVISATDEHGRSFDLQLAMFVDHAPDLQSLPCHLIVTVPISIQANLGDSWEQSPEFVPAIPVNRLLGCDERYSLAGRAALREVVERRLSALGTSVDELFGAPELLDRLIDVSGGHIADLILLVREAVLEAQTDTVERIDEPHIKRSTLRRALEYTRLIETKYLETLAAVDELKASPSSSEEYRELIFKRLVLEYICGVESRVDLHPLVAAADAYRRWRNPRLP
jgi:hypothetical protein